MNFVCSFEMVNMEDQVIAVPIGENAANIQGVIKLNNSGAEIFDLLSKGHDVESIVRSLSLKYDDSYDDLTEMVNDMISELMKMDILFV